MTFLLVCRWVGSETNPADVKAGVQWLKDHVALHGQDVLAITNQSFLRASFLDANIVINGSKTDFVVISAQVGGCPHLSDICTSLIGPRSALGGLLIIKARHLKSCIAGSRKAAFEARPAAKRSSAAQVAKIHSRLL